MKVPLITAVTLAAWASAAHASYSIVHTDTFEGAIDFVDQVSLPQFNGHIDDLLAVEFCYTLHSDGGEIALDNEGEIAATIDGEFGVEISVTGSSVPIVDASFNNILDGASASNMISGVLGVDDGDSPNQVDPTGDDYLSFLGTAVSGSGEGAINTAVWGDYVGSGNFTVDLIVDSYFTLQGEGGSTLLFDSPDFGSGSVTVKYEVIPEPSAALLALLGLGAYGFRRRR